VDEPFEIVRPLGRGGTASVFEVRLPGRPGRYAAKVLARLDERGRERFRREAEAVAALAHPGIVPLRASGLLPDGKPYLVFDLIEGGSLRDVLAAHGPPSPRRAARLVVELGEALGAAHARGILHRDVKPANLLLDREGALCLADFGLALARDHERLTASNELAGTLPYMAPEQLRRGEEQGPPVDVWSAGVVLHELLSGRLPWPTPTGPALYAQILNFEPPRLEGVPEGLAEVVARCLAKLPEERYADGLALAEAVRQAPAGPDA
jgi:serine/threonine-protein kinase